jgi:hypothetical protein
MLGRSPHIAGSPWMHLRADCLREARPAPPADYYNLSGAARTISPLTAQLASAATDGTARKLIASARWVNSYEHTRVNSGERQGHTAQERRGGL